MESKLPGGDNSMMGRVQLSRLLSAHSHEQSRVRALVTSMPTQVLLLYRVLWFLHDFITDWLLTTLRKKVNKEE